MNKHPFYINAEASLVETQNRTHVLAVFTINKVSGNGSGTDFATRQGLAEAYAKAGKEAGGFHCQNHEVSGRTDF